MSKFTLLSVIVGAVMALCQCSSPQKQEEATPPQFTNPILSGFYPDPSICKAGDDYYLITSTFAYFPGLPIFHSKNLVHWEQIGHVLDRPEQLNLDGHGVSRGLFAPAIEYHEGVFYVVCTLIDNGGNFVVTATNPAGPWSNPVWLPEVSGIDPSLFFDGDKTYIVYNSDPPNNQPEYSGHRTIRMNEFDRANLKVISDNVILVNGGADFSQQPEWIEGPHIYKKDGYYYLMAAEGGTAINHTEVILRSKEITGPYEPYENNPILTQKHLDPHRKHPVTTTGHADLIQNGNGDWWAVFLACRPYHADNFYNTGRETFLAPVKWIDGWPVINPDHEEVQYYYPYPYPEAAHASQAPWSGNFSYRDNFDDEKLGLNWIQLRTPREEWFSLTEKPGFVAMNVRPETVSETVNPSFLGHRQQHLKGSAATLLEFTAASENEKAGMLIFMNEDRHYFIAKSIENGEPVVQFFRSSESDKEQGGLEKIASKNLPNNTETIWLKIEARGDAYAFHYAVAEDQWETLAEGLDASYIRADVPRDFTGCIYALYATSSGEESTSKAYFDWFEYSGNDDMYK